MNSYSQHEQDKYICETYFLDRPAGTFVDIGAYDGVTFSNSLLFEQRGWRGICIEPNPAVFPRLRANRSSTCLNCAISDKSGTADFVDVDMPAFGKMYSGLKADYDPRHVALLNAWASASRVIHVRTRRLDEILVENDLYALSYLSIDTEGSELKILKTIDFDVFNIEVISVENNYNDTRVRGYLQRHGYKLARLFADFDELYVRASA
ncbi:MAG TPA: FkbM family methyltransferase [Xanthobacteraceae bacterium]|nr:FkbM family methyltransferase [Xanthobacteraceae bacterium]